MTLISSTGWPLRLLFPLACPLPPLLHLLPKPAGARFYSRFSTSPTFRRPINRHGLLYRTYIPNQASHTEPTIEEIKRWDADKLLEWIQQTRPGLLSDDNLEKFKAAFIRGRVFVEYGGDVGFFKNGCSLPIGVSYELADLVKGVAGGETAGIKRNRQRAASESLVPVERIADVMREIALGETSGMKIRAEEAFKAGIKYKPPRPLVKTSGADWTFQPHPELYNTLAGNVLAHYDSYKRNRIDKTYIPTYFYLGGAGTGKSRHGSEFATSVQEAITLHTQCHELAQRLKKAFVFHVSFENGTSLTHEEKSNPWNAIGVRMLHQLLDRPLSDIRNQYVAEPDAVFRLVAAAENVDLYKDFTGILVIDGLQFVLEGYCGGKDKDSHFYGLLGQIGDLSLMSRRPPETKEGTLREAPFILTCVTATCFGPVQGFLAGSHRKRVYLPLNRLKPPTWKNSLPVFDYNSPVVHLLVDDVGGHARAMELIADELTMYQNGALPNIAELANAILAKLKDRYSEALFLLEDSTLPIAQAILSRRLIRLEDNIPGSRLKWEHVVSSGLIWFERAGISDVYGSRGYLVGPYIWLWMLARLPPQKTTKRLCEFLSTWKFNDYEQLLNLETDQGFPGDTTWQNFEVFCCYFRILRSLGFEDGEKVPLTLLHSGCKLRDDQETMVVNRHLGFARAVHQYWTDSMGEHATTRKKGRSAEEVATRNSGTLNADEQLSHVILNAPTASAGDFFFSIETSAGNQGNIVREAGQCKSIQRNLTLETYDKERNKCAGPDDIFMLYTDTKISDNFALPDRSGLVDKSCWHSYFGPFFGRAFIALRYSGSRRSKNDQTETPHPL